MKRGPSPFEGNWGIWGWVYGVPLVLGVICLMAGATDAASLLIGSVIGSFLLISLLSAMTRL